ncbi:MAG: hypothetical protein ACK5H1_10525 [Tenacibaculum sp.]
MHYTNDSYDTKIVNKFNSAEKSAADRNVLNWAKFNKKENSNPEFAEYVDGLLAGNKEIVKMLINTIYKRGRETFFVKSADFANGILRIQSGSNDSEKKNLPIIKIDLKNKYGQNEETKKETEPKKKLTGIEDG